MKALHIPREKVITEASTNYDLVVLEAVNEYYDTAGDNVAIRRNPNLAAQLQAVKGWGVPVLLRIVSNAQWYCDLIKSMTDEPGWQEAMNKLTIDATSAMIGLSRSVGVPADGLIITAWKDDLKGTTSTWVKETMRHLMIAAEKWALPIWMEFPAVIDAAWDNKQLQVFRDNLGEYAIRNSTKPTLASAEIEMPWNTLSYFPDKPEIPSSPYLLLPIAPLSQVDPRWKDVQLGTSFSTIGGYGCLITCVSMMLDYYGFDTNPALLNEELKGNAGYSNGNLLMWGQVPVIFPGVTYDGKWEGSRNDIIDKCLADGKPAIIHVDYNPATSAIEQHWVLVVGKKDGKYIINDPKDGAQVVFNDRYGDPATKIYNVASYDLTGVVPDLEPPDEWIPSDDMDKALLTLPDILTEAKRTNVLLESVYKLLEANLFRGRL
jgi:hypothetical protein